MNEIFKKVTLLGGKFVPFGKNHSNIDILVTDNPILPFSVLNMTADITAMDGFYLIYGPFWKVNCRNDLRNPIFSKELAVVLKQMGI